jgi:hypothetical protein
LGVDDVDSHWINQDIGSAGNVTTYGDLTLTAGDDIYAHGQLLTETDSGGNMRLSGNNVTVEGTVDSDGILDVDADGDIRLKANISSVDEMTMDAGSDIELNRSSGNTSSESTIMLNAVDNVTIGIPLSGEGDVTTNGHLGIYAGTDSGDNVKVFGKLTTMEGSAGNIDVTAGGDIKLYGSFVDSEYESAQADGDLTLDAGDDVHVLGDLISNNGSIELSSDNTTTYLGGDVTAAIDVTLNNNTEFYGCGDQKVDAQTGMITAKGWLLKDSYSGSLYLEAAGDISLAGDVVVYPGGVSIISENGKIFTPGGDDDTLNVYIEGYSDQFEGSGVELPGDPEKKAAIVIISKKDLKLGLDSQLMAYGSYIPLHVIDLEGIDNFDDLENYWDALYDQFGYVIEDLEYGFEDYLSDLEVSDEIYEDFPLYMEHLSDYLGTLDDRPAIAFLAEPAEIGGIPRDEGKPIDVAIYVASTTGNVEVPVGTKVDIWAGEGVWIDADTTTYVDPGGTMVVDAYDTVTFKGKRININLEDFDWIEDIDDFEWMLEDLFEELYYEYGIEIDTEDFSNAGKAYFTALGYVDDPFDDPDFLGHFDNFLEDYLQGIGARFTEGGIIDRLEVSSRITEWLFQAAGPPARLPFAGDPIAIAVLEDFIGGDYILRGAGLGNLLITDGRAWVLENPVPSPPLHQEAGAETEDEEFAEGGCPPLMNWLANEIGIPAEDIQVALAGALALNTDIQPCEMCARLMSAATTLEDAEGTQIAAMAQVVNEFVTTPAPPSPEQMTSIAAALAEHVGDGTHYAAAGQWIDALVAYVGIMNAEMGYSASDSVAFAQKHLTPITEAGNAALTAYVQARLAALGG